MRTIFAASQGGLPLVSVLWTILPSERHLDFVSNDYGSARSEELCNRHGVLLCRNLHQKGLSGVKKTVCRPLSLSMFTRNQSILQDRLDAERTTPVKDFLLPVVRNPNVLHQLRVTCFSTRVSVNCSEVSLGIFGILAVLESCLAASFMNKSKPALL